MNPSTKTSPSSFVSSSKFIYDPKTKTFSAEASDFNGENVNLQMGYSDASSNFTHYLGFTMMSEKTGDRVRFRYEGATEREGEVVAWNWRCIRKGLEDVTVVIFND